MLKSKYIFGKTIEYNGERRKITGIKFAFDGVWYKLSGIKEWLKEDEV